MKALVTGAAGLVGSNLCAELQAQGHEVFALDSFGTGSFINLQDFRGDMFAYDLRKPEEWAHKLPKVDAVFHQAAITDTTVNDQRLMMAANVEAFRNLLDWAAKQKVKRVVYASSAGVYGDRPVPQKESAAPKPLNVYAFSKMVMEATARDFQKSHKGMTIAGLRYFNVFGPRETHKAKAASMIYQLAQQMKQGKRPRIFEFGDQFRDFIYVKDVVRANMLAAQKGAKGVFNVCTGKKTTFNDIIRELNAVLGLSLQPDYFKNPYSFYQNETLGDPGAAVRAFGFSAKYTTAAGIQDYFGAAQKPAKV
jgi:ADP-L-glycero-D-manno-heptose 6-epimerase